MVTEAQFDLIIVGEAAHDLLLDYPTPVSRPGGAFYSAVAAAARGARVGVISDVGTDWVGGHYSQLLDLGINLDGIEQTASKGIRYEIRNTNEIIPQVTTTFGIRNRPKRLLEFPDEYQNTRALLLYPYQRDILTKAARIVHQSGGKIYFDLQHDVTSLEDWSDILALCDVVLASRGELLVSTSQKREQDAASTLIEYGAKHVIVKYGIGGSAVYSEGQPPILVPAFLARFKCTIGAGDVFNAVFALEHSDGQTPEAAAKNASVASTVFIEKLDVHDYFRVLSELEYEQETRRRVAVHLPPYDAGEIRFYIAGHFLSEPMRMWVDRVTFALESRGFIVFSPYRDVGILGASSDVPERRKYFMADLEGIDRANFVIALLDGLGRGGTSWELGYAYRGQIPILGLLTYTSRQLSNMVEESCEVIVSSIPALLNEIYMRASVEQ